MTRHEKPIWDRGDPIDEELLAFTVGDDWKMDQRLVSHELRGSRVHALSLVVGWSSRNRASWALLLS